MISRRNLLTASSLALPDLLFAKREKAAAPCPQPGSVQFRSWDTRFPILYRDQPLETLGKIVEWEFFQPVFGADRERVNPTAPALSSGAISFPAPGEYYLKINGRQFFRTCILERGELVYESALRVFDFTVANMFYGGVDDPLWAKPGRTRTIWNWFTSREPLMFSCGPTHALFRWLIEDRLGLPTRVVTFPGTYFRDGALHHDTHNVAEVYLPDFKKFVLFDVNNAFVPPWRDAISLAELVTDSLGDEMTQEERAQPLGIELHQKVMTRYPHAVRYPTAVRAAAENGTTLRFSSGLVGDVTAKESKATWLRLLYGGVAYWGQNVGWQRPTGTEFLPGDYLFVNLHRNDHLARQAIEWVKALANVKVTTHSPGEMRDALATGHKSEIAAEKWWGKRR